MKLLHIFIMTMIWAAKINAQGTSAPKENQRSVHLDSTAGQLVIHRTPLMDLFWGKFKVNQPFDYQQLYGDDGYPLPLILDTTVSRIGLEQNWKSVEHEKAVALYVCLDGDEPEFLLRDEGSLDIKALKAINDFVESGRRYVPKDYERIQKSIENYLSDDSRSFLSAVERKVEVGGELLKGEKEAYKAILRYAFHRSTSGDIPNYFQTTDQKTYYLLCLFHNHNDGNPPSQGDYDASMAFPMGVARFYENDSVQYEFLVSGKTIRVMEPLSSPPLRDRYPPELQYRQSAVVQIMGNEYVYGERGDTVWMSIEIQAQPELLAMLMFDHEANYFGIISRNSLVDQKSISQFDGTTTIPNGTITFRVPSKIHYFKTVSANGELRVYTPSFVKR